MRSFVLKNDCNRALLCWRFPPLRVRWTLFPINKDIILVLWFLIICCSAFISAIFLYFVAISVLFSALFLYSANIIDLVPYRGENLCFEPLQIPVHNRKKNKPQVTKLYRLQPSSLREVSNQKQWEEWAFGSWRNHISFGTCWDARR